MPRHLLTAKQIIAARDRDLADGEGLIVRVKGISCTAVLRFTSPISHKRRELGLGLVSRQSLQAAGETLVAARDAAEDARRLIRNGLDPIDVRDAKRAEARAEDQAAQAATKSAAISLRRFARNYHDEHVEPLRSTRHALQWINSIERNVPDKFLDQPIDRITPLDLLDTLVPIMRRVPETGSRIYRRLSTVFDAAVIGGLIAANPASPIRRELRRRVGEVERTNYAAMDYPKVPAFTRRLQAAPGTAARCLEFAILTGARTTEALNAEWSEMDLKARTWIIPTARMKARQPHVVYLSDRTLHILRDQRGQSEQLVFPSVMGSGKPMSNMSLAMTLRRLGEARVTVHGFRASFSTWAYEMNIATPGAIEASLAHRERDRVTAAYNRATFIAERRALMVAWGNFLAGRRVVRADGTPVTDAAVIHFPAQETARSA
jgi:integrase